MITVWATCRKFVREQTIIDQTNAIESWKRLSDDVMLLGREEGLPETAKKLGIRHVPDVRCNKWGTPYLVSLFEQARKHAKYDILCSVCCDMILMDDLVTAAEGVASKFPRFLMVGLKWHLGYSTKIDFSTDWQGRLRESARKKGEQHKRTGGSDYFVYPKGLFADMEFPGPLVRGRYRDDIWLITSTLERGIPVVDATDVVMAIHQPHRKHHRGGPEVEKNIRYTRHLKKKSVRDATWKLTKEGLNEIFR